MIYRIHKKNEMGESFGYEYFGDRRSMIMSLRRYDSTDKHKTPKNKQEMIQMLRRWARHNDNG